MKSFALSLPSIFKIWKVKSFPKTFHKRVLSCAKSELKSSSGVTPCSFKGPPLSSVQIYKNNADSIVKILSHCQRDSVDSVECGSGIIWDQKGHIITNSRIIHGTRDLRIIIQDSVASEAEVIAYDVRSDVSILRVNDGEKLKPIQRGVSENLMVGEDVYAIGYPLGLQKSFAAGIISCIHREKTEFAIHRNMIQTHARLNMGNVGGALLDSSGCLIGMNTRPYTDGHPCGIGFAIPIDQLAGAVEALFDAVKSGK